MASRNSRFVTHKLKREIQTKLTHSEVSAALLKLLADPQAQSYTVRDLRGKIDAMATIQNMVRLGLINLFDKADGAELIFPSTVEDGNHRV